MRNPITSIGEMVISTTDKDFFFKPSFNAMANIGTPQEIVEIYATMNGLSAQKAITAAISSYGRVTPFLLKSIAKPAYGREVLSAAIIIMRSCCEDDISGLVGSWKPSKKGMIYVRGGMPVADIVTIGRRLMEHGVIGMSKMRRLQKDEGKQGEFTKEFNVMEYISMARAHFGMSREQAEDLTMTELQELIKVKFPPQKGYTREERKAANDFADNFRAKKLAQEKAKQKEAASHGQ